jgi:serine/threonine protein kinase/tetratricopeptide (TPR) repeat protein/pimeloyl-ACP methyl ester carboxylesterase
MGQGPPLVKAANWLSHLEFDLQSPVWEHWLRELSRDHTLIRYDERGCGLSDWDVEEFSTEAWVRDLEAVVDAAELAQFALLGISQGGAVAIEYAARHPERLTHLILYGAYGRGWGVRDDSEEARAEREALLTLIRVGWGQDSPAYRQVFTGLFVPDANDEQIEWFNELQRVSTSPENAVEFQRAFSRIDVTNQLDQLDVEPLILHAADEMKVPFEEGRRLAAAIPGSTFASLPSRNHLLLEHEPAWEQFLGDVRRYLGVSTERSAIPADAHALLDLERRRLVEELFEAALDLNRVERPSFLSSKCGRDAELRAEVEALLQAHERSEGILDITAEPAEITFEPGDESPGSVSARSEEEAPWGVMVQRPWELWLIPAAGAYIVGALFLMLTADLSALTPTIRAWVYGATVVGFPVALFLAWRFGRRRTALGQARADGLEGSVESGVADSAAELEPGRRVAHYDVEGHIGRGGMGVVYQARDTRLDRAVALKFLPTHLSADEGARHRFLVEAQAAAALDHPHICTIHEIGMAPDGRLFIAMPYYEGETLREKIDRGPLNVDEAVELAVQVTRGLSKAHEVGVIHRDIKPANVLVTTDGIAKIVDFGLAKLIGVDLTQTAMTMGTVAYMSPEQAYGKEVDERTDLWSLGVMFYEMLCGSRPFTGDNSVAVMHAIMKREPEPIEERREGLPPGLPALVHSCLAKEPADRLASAEQLLSELSGLQAPPGPARTVSDQATATLSSGGERRSACIVASSIANYSELVERMSPEELDALIGRIHEEVALAIQAEGGVVNSSSGDQIVSLFGIPAASEDDSRRAVAAALAVHERIVALNPGLGPSRSPPKLQLRTGIGMGVVVVQSAGSPDHRYRIAGLAVDAASRLAAHAGADEVLIGEECQRRVAPFFVMEEGEPLQSRGSAERLVPYRVLRETRIRSPFDAADGLTAFVGRERELAALAEASEEAAGGEGRFVSIIGDAGAGKSRLLFEFCTGIDRKRMRVLEGRCLEKAAKGLYVPFADMLRARLGAERGSFPDVDECVRSLLAISTELETFLPYYLHLLGIESGEYPVPDLEGGQIRVAMLEALTALFMTDASRQPVALLLENWQHADGASRDVLGQLTEMVAAHPLLIVATARPDPSLDWGTPTYHLPIHLGPLSASASSALVASVLGAQTLPSDLADRLHERTGGNPFFLEEVCNALVEERTLRVEGDLVRLAGPLDSLELPDTVQGVIRTRLDRLDPEARSLVAQAAVIGREFPEALLREILPEPSRLEEGLLTLRDRGVVQQIGVSPNVTYRFTHAPTQEVAYDSLLRHRQEELHGKVGEAIEKTYGDALEEHFDRLAFQFGAAGVWWKAVLYGQKAADRAEELGQFGDALELLDRTLNCVDRLPTREEREEVRIRILFKQERLCETIGHRDRQQGLVAELVRLLEPKGANSRLAEAYLRKGDLHTLTREFSDAARALVKALEVARDVGDRAAERSALRSSGLLRWHQNRSEEAISLQEQALAIDRELEDADGIMIELMNLGNLYKGLGRYEKALDLMEEAVQVRESYEGEDLAALDRRLSYVLHNIGNLYRALGDNEKAVQYIDRAVTYAGGAMRSIHRSYHLTALAHIRLQEGQVEESLELYRQAVKATRKSRTAEGLAQALRVLGLGRSEDALPYLVEAAETFERLRDREAQADMLQATARAHEDLEETAQASAAWNQVRLLGERYHNEVRVLASLEALARLSGAVAPGRARNLYDRAIELARQLGRRSKEAALINSLAILHWQEKEHEQAVECYEAALHTYKDLEDWVHAGLILNSLGVTLRDMDRSEEAAAHLEEALEVNRMTGERLLEAHSHAALGELEHGAGRYESAVARFETSLDIRREVEDRAGMGWMMYRMARSNAALGSSTAARNLVSSAAEIAEEVEDGDLVVACRNLEI